MVEDDYLSYILDNLKDWEWYDDPVENQPCRKANLPITKTGDELRSTGTPGAPGLPVLQSACISYSNSMRNS